MVKLMHYMEESGTGAPTTALSSSADDIINRLQPNDLVKSMCRELSPFVSDDFIEDILLDIADTCDSKSENRFKATYPPGDMSTSSFTILKQPALDVNCRTLRSKNSPESFLKIVANAYTGVQRNEDAGTKLQCNLISQQLDTDNMIVNSFQFESEMDYWTFVGELKRSITCIQMNMKQEEDIHVGYCHYTPSALQTSIDQTTTNSTTPSTSSNNNKSTATAQRAAHRPSGGGGFLGSLFSAQKEVQRTHRWEVKGATLTITDTHSHNKVGVAVGIISDNIVAAFDLHDLIALTLSVDHPSPSAALLVTSLAHADKDRDRAKESDPTGICTSSAYHELQVEVSLQRLCDRIHDVDTTSATKAQSGIVYRRGIGELSVLPLSEEEIVLVEHIERGGSSNAGAGRHSDSSPLPPGPSSPSPKSSFGIKSLRSSVTVGTNMNTTTTTPTPISGVSTLFPTGLSNTVEVKVRDRYDPESIVALHSLSLADMVGDPGNASSRHTSMRSSQGRSSLLQRHSSGGPDRLSIDTSQHAVESAGAYNQQDAAVSRSPTPASSSVFGSFYRTAKTSTTANTTTTHASTADTTPIPAESRARAALLGKDISPMPGGSGGSTNMLAPRRVIYNDPLYCDIEMSLKANLKAARLVLKCANDLPSSSPSLEAKGIPPTVYATVYLVDANGEKRSVNSADSRTEAIKSFDPAWNKEVLLQNEKQGVDDITAVMVLFRDAAMGMLKHHHIGRVTIPFSCFLDNTQADFCLPLEPTYRMEGAEGNYNLGDVHFTTELIEMGPGNRRIASIVRASLPHGTTVPATSAAGQSAEATSATTTTEIENKTTSTTTAPVRRATVIASTGGNKQGRNIAAVRYCLYRASAGGVWWPTRLLQTVLVSNTSTSLTHAAQLHTSPTTACAFGPRSGCTGFVWCGHRDIMIELVPGVTGVLYNCQECIDGVLVIPWLNVLDCLDVSDTTVLLTLQINTCTSNATQISKNELNYAPAKTSLLVGPCPAAAFRRLCQQRAQFSFIRENLVELVQAVSAVAGVQITSTAPSHTTTSSIAAGRLRSFTLAKTPPTSPGMVPGQQHRQSFAQSNPPNSQHPSEQPIHGPAATSTGGTNLTLSQLLAANTSTLSMGNTTTVSPTILDILPMSRSVAIALEGIIQHVEALLNRSLVLSLEGRTPYTSLAKGVLTPTLLSMNPPVFNALTTDLNNAKKTILPASSPIVQDRQSLVRTMASAKVYFAHLRYICGRLLHPTSHIDVSLTSLLPEFTTDAIQRHVKLDCENVQLFTPLRTGARVETMISRFEHFLEAALERIRDYIIFSGGIWETTGRTVSGVVGTKARSPSVVGNTALGFSYGDIESHTTGMLPGRECVQILISSYYQTILNYLKPFVGNKEVFRKLVGQDTKNCVLRLVVENNFRFDHSTQLVLGASLNYCSTASMPMVEDLSAVMEWYSDSLLHDTRRWLIRTSQNASAERKNTSNLPWDVELLGETVVSFLPETLRFQLNVYTELCSVNLTTTEYEDAESKASAVLESGQAIGVGMNMPSGMQLHSYIPTEPSLNQAVIAGRVNEMILHAVVEALVLLAEEYLRALQGRHWDRVDPTTGKFAVHLDFLAAVANDCHRVLTRHVPELQETIRTSPIVYTTKRAHLVTTFSEPADIAVRNMMRIVFIDVQSTLIEFDTLWNNPRNLIARTLTAAIGSHLRSRRLVLAPDVYFKLLGCCAQVVVMRFLLFLKARSASRIIMSVDDTLRFVRDVSIVKQNFYTFIGEAEPNALTSGSSVDGEDTDTEHNDHRNLPILSSSAEDPLIAECLEDISQGTTSGKYIVKSSFECLDAICHLLSADYDTAVFHRTASSLVERYEHITAADGGRNSSTAVLGGDCTTVSGALLLGCIAPLRSDAGPDLNSFLGAILLSQQHSHSAVHSRTPSPLSSHSVLSQDVIVRTFAASYVGGGGTTSSNVESDLKTGFKSLLSPGATIKHWREKAADIAVKKGPGLVSAVKNRQNEETAVELMRALGLEGQSQHSSSRGGPRASEEGLDSQPSVAGGNRRSGRQDPATLAAAGIASRGAGSFPESTSAARSLHSEFADSDHTRHDPVEKQRKKKNGMFNHFVSSVTATATATLNKENRDKEKEVYDSSSDSDVGATDTPAQCLIQIEDVQVRALHSISFIGGPNPYVYFSVNGRRSAKTSVKWDHKDASWNSTLELPTDLLTIQEGRIEIKVFDKERMRRKRLMGSVSVKLAPLEFHSFEGWYALEGGEQGNYGEVYCRLRMISDASML